LCQKDLGQDDKTVVSRDPGKKQEYATLEKAISSMVSRSKKALQCCKLTWGSPKQQDMSYAR